ncbi:MAG TPA: hypothetical protein PKA74_09465 [Bauldia sp.]|nr:hypothetical protein [Bauldia sp.]
MRTNTTFEPVARIVRVMRSHLPVLERPAPVRWQPSFTGGWPYR